MHSVGAKMKYIPAINDKSEYEAVLKAVKQELLDSFEINGWPPTQWLKFRVPARRSLIFDLYNSDALPALNNWIHKLYNEESVDFDNEHGIISEEMLLESIALREIEKLARGIYSLRTYPNE